MYMRNDTRDRTFEDPASSDLVPGARVRQLEVFGRRLLVERTPAGWKAYTPGDDGKRRSAPGVVIPDFIVTDDELLQFLADLMHEDARPDRSTVRWVD